MDWKMGKKFFVVSSLACFTLGSSFVEAVDPCSSVSSEGSFNGIITDINNGDCTPPLSISGDFTLTDNAEPLAYAGTVDVESSSSGTARTINGGGFSILSTITEGTTISLSSDIQLNDGLISVGPGIFVFNDEANWHTGSTDLTSIAITDTGTVRFLTAGGTFSPDITLSGTSNIEVDNGLTVTASGDITDADSPGELQKLGDGILIVTGMGNLYSGGTDIQEGVLELGDDFGLGTGSLSIRNTATFRLQDTIVADNNIMLFGNSFIDVPSGTAELDGTINGSGAFTVTGGANLVLTGANAFTGGITLEDLGTLELRDDDAAGSGDITFTSGTTLSLPVDGTTIGNSFVLAGTDTVDVPTSVSVTLSGNGSGSGSLYKAGAGALLLIGDSSFSGGVDLAVGALELGDDSGLGTGSLSVRDGTTFRLQDGIVADNNIILFGNSVIDVGSGTAELDGTINGDGGFTIDGDGSLVLAGANSFSGPVTLADGTVVLADDDALSTVVLTMDDSTTLELRDGITASNDIELINAASIHVTSGNAALSGVISGSGCPSTGGAGSLTLSGVNTYLGTTTVTESTLYLAGAGSIASSDSVVVNSGAAFDISGISGPSTQINPLSGSGNVVLGSKTLVVNSSFDSTFSGTMSGTGSLTKEGDCTLTLTGANTYSGGTLVSAGTLKGNTNGLQGNIENNAQVTFALSTAGTYPGILSGSGDVVKTGDATLTFSGANTYTGSTSIEEGKVFLSGSGSFGTGSVALATGTGIILGNGVDLSSPITLAAGSPAPEISVPSGASAIISGPITGSGGFDKQDLGLLLLSGTSTYTGDTNVAAGTLIVSGSITSDVFVASDATLRGCGNIEGDVNAAAGSTVKPGCSVGDLIINGDVQQDGLLDIEVEGDLASRLIVSGSFSIGGNQSVHFDINPPLDVLGQTLNIVEAGSVIGTFTTETTNVFLIEPVLTYTGTEVNVTFDLVDLSTVLDSANAIAVGDAIRTVTVEEEDLTLISIVRSLLVLDSYAEAQIALDAMQPAQYKGLTISQENNAVKIQDTLGYRFQQTLNEVHCYLPKSARTTDPTTGEESVACEKEKKAMHLWVDGFGDVLRQKSNNYAHSPQIGYQTKTAGVSMGLDGLFAEYFYLGALGAYTSSDTKWFDDAGKGDIDTGYAGLYFSAIGDLFYVNTSVIGAWSHYSAHRNIVYPGVSETASNTHGGSQLLSHLDTGLNFGIPGFTIRPFDAFDYVTQTENGYTETGAGVYNLNTDKVNSIMLRNELGLQFAGCLCFSTSKWTISPKISWVREVRIKGATYKSEFVNTDVPFVVTGYFPDRSLVSPGVMVSGLMLKDLLALDLYYNGEFGNKYSDHNYGGQIRFGF